MCCLNLPYVWCFKAPYINKLSNTRELISMTYGLPYVVKFVNKGWHRYNMINKNTIKQYKTL